MNWDGYGASVVGNLCPAGEIWGSANIDSGGPAVIAVN
jgi:hypothetical protein